MNEFMQKVPGRFGLFLSYGITIFLFGSILLHSIILQPKFDQAIIGALVSVFAIAYFTRNLWLLLRSPSKLAFDSEWMSVTFTDDRMEKVPLACIMAVAGLFGSAYTVRIVWQDGQTSRSFLTHIDRVQKLGKLAFGELVEQILDKATNIQRVEIESILKLNYRGEAAWGKLPDWNTINTAKRRAEKNQVKRKLEF